MATDKENSLTADQLANLPKAENLKKAEKTQEEKDQEREVRESEKLKTKLWDKDQEIKRLTYLLDKAQEEKKKPGIQVIEEDGTMNTKKKRVNSSGLSDQILPPYMKNQVAIYRIIGTEEINPATGLKVDPVDTLVPGRYTLYDKFEKDPLKKDKVMKNLNGTEQYVENGKVHTREVIEDVIFTRGWLQVPVESKYNLYVFMELHPMNKNNRFRPSNSVVAFERVDLQHKSPVVINMTADLALDAGIKVRSMTKEEVLSYCVTAIPPIRTAGRRPDEYRADLIRYAMNNPVVFFKQNRDMKAAIAITVADALSFGIITYMPQQKTYINSETDETIFTHSIQEDPTDSLIKFLAKEEQREVYQNLVDRLNYWSNEEGEAR